MVWRRLGQKVSLGIGADRYGEGRTLELQGVEWFILDDGLQHWPLARDVEIILIDASNPFGGGFLLPAGPLREPKSALHRADLVVITRSDRAPAVEAIVRRYTPAPVFYARPELRGLNEIGRPSAEPPVSRDDKKFFAFCAIGNSRAFFDDLRRWGLRVVGERAFPDHHRYSAEDARRLEKAAEAAGADALLCTEKDVFRYSPHAKDNWPVLVCRTELQVFDPEKFWTAVNDIIERKRTRAEQ